MPKICIQRVHISSAFDIVYVGSEQSLDSRECRAHCATYSCLGNINHEILTTDFSYCDYPEVSSNK